MLFVGLLALIALGGVTVWFAGHVYQEVKASGAFAATPKGVRGTAQRARVTAKGAPAAARRTARTAPARVRQAPQKVSHIVAGALATNWLEKRRHLRVNGRPPREPLLHRLVFPGKRIPAAATPNGNQPAQVTPAQPAATPQPATPRPAPPQPQPAPPPANPGRTQPAMTTATTSSGTASGSDLLAAVNTITGHARSGGIRSKGYAFAAFREGFAQQAAGLEQFARDLQETGRYGPEVWEPAMKAAAHMRAAGAEMAEGSAAVSTLARTPMGEVATSQVNAPTQQEINTA